MSITFVNSGPIQPSQGIEVPICSLSGGPYDAVNAFIAGGGIKSGANQPQMQIRLYATVGSVRSLVDEVDYSAGTNILFSAASGNSYDLTVYQLSGDISLPIRVTLAGALGSDVAANQLQSGSVPFPGSFQESTVVTNNGYSEFADVSIDQANIPSCNVILYASCGAGSVECPVQTVGVTGRTLGNQVTQTNIVAVMKGIPLPVATTYRVAVQNTTSTGTTVSVHVSLATFSVSFASDVITTATIALASGAIHAGQAFVVQNGSIAIATQANLASQYTLGGLALGSGIGGDKIPVIYFGPVNPGIISLGIGGICAVGVDVNGNPVRVTDASCLSGLKYLGTCDIDGTITVAPIQVQSISVIDFGMDNTGTNDNVSVWNAIIQFISNNTQIANINFPPGRYRFNSTITVPSGQSYRVSGSGLSNQLNPNIYKGGSQLLFYGPGTAIQISTNASGNVACGTTIEDLEILGYLDTGFAAGSNINKIGIEVLGAVGVTIQRCRSGSFQYQISMDGAEGCRLVDHLFDGGGDLHGYQDLLTNLDGCIDLDIVAATNASPIAITLASSALNDASNTVPITVSTIAPNNWQSGQKVTITGVLGNLGANGTFSYLRTGSNSGLLQSSRGTGAYAGGGTLTANAETGQQVTIQHALGNTGANGTFSYVKTGPSTGTLIGSHGNGAYTGGGTLTAPIDSAVACRIGSFNFNVGNSANGCFVEHCTFNNTRWGTLHQDGGSHVVSRCTYELPGGYAIIQSPIGLRIEDCLGEAATVATYWFTSWQRDGRGACYALSLIGNQTAASAVPILIDNAYGQIVHAALVANQLYSFYNAAIINAQWVTGVVNAIGNYPPTSGLGLVDTDILYSPVGTVLNNLVNPSAVLDAYLTAYSYPLWRFRTLNFIWSQGPTLSAKDASQFDQFEQLTHLSTTPSTRYGRGLVFENILTAAGPTNFKVLAPVTEGAGVFVLEVTARWQSNPAKVVYWKIRQLFDEVAGVVTLLSTPSTLDSDTSLDATFNAPTIVATGTDLQVRIAGHPTQDTSWSVRGYILESMTN